MGKFGFFGYGEAGNTNRCALTNSSTAEFRAQVRHSSVSLKRDQITPSAFDRFQHRALDKHFEVMEITLCSKNNEEFVKWWSNWMLRIRTPEAECMFQLAPAYETTSCNGPLPVDSSI